MRRETAVKRFAVSRSMLMSFSMRWISASSVARGNRLMSASSGMYAVLGSALGGGAMMMPQDPIRKLKLKHLMLWGSGLF
jgi:hypothetical protein